MGSQVESAGSSFSRRQQPPDGNELTVGSSIRPVQGHSSDATHISARPPLSTTDGLAESPGYAIGKSLVGASLDHFVLEEFVGGGGMGAVFRARDQVLDRSVAIKVLARDKFSDPETYQRFQNEGRSAARLDHPNIARVYYSGESNGLAYIVFEFVEGINLRDLVLEFKRLPTSEAVGYALQLAEALAHASERDVVHRDIKPSNVIIGPQGHVKLVDMGLARVRLTDQPHDDLTASGVTLGTFDYISPEQARDPRFADVRSDIYSLGCTLYYMLTGRPPYPEGTVLQKLLQHQGDAAPDPRELNPEVPAEVAAIVGKMMAKDPMSRYQDAREVVADLLLVGERLGLRSGSPSGVIWINGPTAASRWIDRHGPWVAAVAVLVLTVVGLDYAWSGRRSEAIIIERPTPGAVEAPPPAAERVTPSETEVAEAPPDPAGTRPDTREDTGLTRESVTPERGPRTATVPPSDTRAANDAPTPNANQGSEVAATARAGVLVVDPTGVAEQSFPSLFAACSMARSGDVIELRFNGRHAERPVVIANQNLTIRAPRGYLPVLVFRPSSEIPDGERGMISVSGGRVTVVDVALEVELDGDSPRTGISLFELRAAEGIVLRNCSLSVRDLAWDRSSVVRAAMMTLASPFATSAMPPSDADDVVDPTVIELENCLARGEATFLASPDLWPFSLSWDNGLVALSGRLLEAQGALMPFSAEAENEIDLRHLTMVVPRGMCRFAAAGPSVYFLPTDVRLADSLVQVSGSGALIEHVGINPLSQTPPIFSWRGQRNVYDVLSLWRTGADGEMPLSGTNKEFNDWVSIWKDRESQARQLPIAWQRVSPATRPMHLRTLSDYLLDPTHLGNIVAIASASDGRDLGMDATQMPVAPGEP